MKSIEDRISSTENRMVDFCAQLIGVVLQTADVRDPEGVRHVLQVCNGADVQLTIKASGQGHGLVVALHLLDAEDGEPLVRIFEIVAEREVPVCRH